MFTLSSPIQRYRASVGVGWILLGIAAAVYAHLKAIPPAIALPLAIAFLLEYPFYLLPGFAAARDHFISKEGKARAAAIYAAGAVVPWMVYAVSTRHFNVPAAVVICCIALLMCFWYVAFPAHPATDLIYLGFFAVILLFKVFVRIYPAPMPKLDVSILGHLMLIRVAAFSIVGIRGDSGVNDYRFIPNKREWIAGVRWFAILMPFTAAVYWGLGLAHPRTPPLNFLLVIPSFFGILWVVSLSEEFVFRGLLQPWIGRWTRSPLAGLIVTSLLFGSVHLAFHGVFPNWRMAIVAAVLGLFCGMARRQTGGIQAGMVAHALTVVVWLTFLK